MARYRAYAIYTASKYLGEVEADTKEAALEKAEQAFLVRRVSWHPTEYAFRLAIRHPSVLRIESARHFRQIGVCQRLHRWRFDAEKAARLLCHGVATGRQIIA